MQTIACTLIGLYEICPPLTVAPSPDDLLVVKAICYMEEQLFIYHKSSWVIQQSLQLTRE